MGMLVKGLMVSRVFMVERVLAVEILRVRRYWSLQIQES